LLVDRIDAVRRSGRPGTARELRTRTGVFLGWAADQGLLATNPLAGWRQPRRTRAERISRPGRALRDSELAGFWHAAGARGWPFGPYLKMLLLLGQRRTETSRMAWSDLVFEEGAMIGSDREKRMNLWVVRAEITKSGRAHCIPLPRQAVAILRSLPRLNKVDLVFPGRNGRPMAGWSRRLPDVYAATARAGIDPWTPHDLRRTMRTGVGKLGIEPVVAELLLDHAISDDLARIYDLGDYWRHRVDAAQRWADHVFAQMPSAPHHSPSNVVELTKRRS
jgi:integrase